MKEMIETLRAEEARLKQQLAAVQNALIAYEAPSMVTTAMVGVQKKAKRSVSKKVKALPKARKKRAQLTDEVRNEVVRLKSLPKGERPTIPDIAAKVGIARTSVERIWQQHRAQPASVAVSA